MTPTPARSSAPDEHTTRAAPTSCVWVVGLIDLPFIPDISELFEDAIEWVLINVVEGVLDFLTLLFSIGFETFLFYPNPATVDNLDTVWHISLTAFTVVAFLSFLYILLMAQYFPGTDSADLQLHLERVAKYFAIVFFSREAIAFAVAFTHTLTGFYYRASYDLSLGVTMIRRSFDGMGLYLTFQWGLLACFILLVAGLGLLFILVARMLVVFLTYALLPLLLAFQLVDVGPWSRVNELGEKFVTASAKLMLFGIVVTAFIWGSTLVLDFTDYDSPDGGSFAGGDTTTAAGADANFATSESFTDVLVDFFFLVTPILIIDYLGFKVLMSLI